MSRLSRNLPRLPEKCATKRVVVTCDLSWGFGCSVPEAPSAALLGLDVMVGTLTCACITHGLEDVKPMGTW